MMTGILIPDININELSILIPQIGTYDQDSDDRDLADMEMQESDSLSNEVVIGEDKAAEDGSNVMIGIYPQYLYFNAPGSKYPYSGV